jgi:hypothetical protein
MEKFMKIFCYIYIICLLIIYTNAIADTSVVSVKGKVQYKAGKQWAAVTTGLKLIDGTKISTGANSEVVLNVNNDNTVTVRQLTMIKIDESTLGKDDSTIRVSLKRGSLNARVARLKTLRTSFKITTPVATSSVRGTQEEVSYGPGRGMIIKVIEGIILAENRLGSSNFIRGKLEFQQEKGKSEPGNIDSNLKNNSFGSLFVYLTDEEKKYLQLLLTEAPTIPGQNDTLTGLFNQNGTGNVRINIIKP